MEAVFSFQYCRLKKKTGDSSRAPRLAGSTSSHCSEDESWRQNILFVRLFVFGRPPNLPHTRRLASALKTHNRVEAGAFFCKMPKA